MRERLSGLQRDSINESAEFVDAVLLGPLDTSCARENFMPNVRRQSNFSQLKAHDEQLERLGLLAEGQDSSPFQYIVTMTTQPPPEFQKKPWLRLELHGAPATERLLRCDLT